MTDAMCADHRRQRPALLGCCQLFIGQIHDSYRAEKELTLDRRDEVFLVYFRGQQHPFSSILGVPEEQDT